MSTRRHHDWLYKRPTELPDQPPAAILRVRFIAEGDPLGSNTHSRCR
jgi:hypothetical protein